MKKLYVMLTAAVLAFAACSKDDKALAETETGSEKLYARVIGKWSFSGKLNLPPSAVGASSTDRKAAAARTAEDEVFSHLEFQSDSTYYIYDTKGRFYSGTFSAKDSNTISLSGLGTLSSITFAQGTINFQLLYADNNKVFITASEAEQIALTDTAKLLCRRWYLTREDNGDFLYFAARAVFDENGEFVSSFVADSVLVQFTTSGTYMLQMFKDKELRAVDVFNWKWYPPLRGYFVLWTNGLEPNEELDKGNIVELSESKFKMAQSADYNGDGEIKGGEINSWTLIPPGK